jgi:histidyl-tRNA synthetase
VANLIQAIRGMNDILPIDTTLWQHVEYILQQILHSYGYQEIRCPVVEKTELFKRTIGQTSDIVTKEMYTFIDRNDDSLTLRPEGTASCVRAGIEHGLLYNQIQRLWYSGPFFRHERPQKGRYRQFHQYGVEAFGLKGPDIDAELIVIAATLFDKLGLKSRVQLQLNSLGTPTSRIEYRKQLQHYFNKHKASLDKDSIHRSLINPLRMLDSKDPALKTLIAKAPKALDHLDEESAQHFERLKQYLTHVGISFEINPYLVRGLDYYTKTVFEWTTDKLGAQTAVCSGGRYDDLVEQLGGKSTPAIGFALGMERLILLMKQSEHRYEPKTPHVYLIGNDEVSFANTLRLANYLHNNVPGLRLVLHCGGGNLKNQLKKADKSGAQYALIIGERESKAHSVSLKPLRENIPQQVLFQDELAEYLKLKVIDKSHR